MPSVQFTWRHPVTARSRFFALVGPGDLLCGLTECILELDEAHLDGLRHEVLEETGLHIEPVALSGVYKNMPKGIIALVFRCHVIGGSPRTSTETEQAAWLTREEVNDRMSEAFAMRITDALDFTGVPALRTHDGQHVG